MIYLIDNMIMPEIRTKRVRGLNYQCGRKSLIQTIGSEQFKLCLTSEYSSANRGIFPELEILYSADNNLRDFSGYKRALYDAIDNNYDQVILCNSSCTPRALSTVIKTDRINRDNILSPGMKSFVRYDTFKIYFYPHLQTYCLRLEGENTIAKSLDYIIESEKKFEEIEFRHEAHQKDMLILNFEVGLSKYLSKVCRRYFLNSNGDLIELGKLSTVCKTKFFDSRYGDPRFA